VDFEFDEDQRELQAAAAVLLAKECPPALLREAAEGADRGMELWSTMAGVDWPTLAVAAADGGVGASFLELAIVLEQLGTVGDPSPFLATTTQFAPLVAALGDDAQRARFLGAIAADELVGTLALAGAEGGWDARSPAVEAHASPEGWTLHGTASLVFDGDRATEVAVVATTPDGPAVFVVPATDVGIRRLPCLDGALHLAELTFADVPVPPERLLGAPGPATEAAVAAMLDEAVTGLALVMVGACQRALDLVIAYVNGREQFGVPIGSFQAVKHKVVDMYVTIERARALGYFAALAIAEDDPRRSLAASMAKAAAGDAQRLVFQHGIQLHGGIGFTWENDVHLYLRRAKAGELLLGGAREHRRRVGLQLTDPDRSPTAMLVQGAVDGP